MKTTLYKDDQGNLWYYEEYDGLYHKLTVVDYEDGQYIYTYITSYFTEEEFRKFERIEMEV